MNPDELARVTAERDAALAVIEKAPHGSDCQRLQVMPTAVQIVDGTWQDGECSCWKSSVDTSALAERDAETRRQAGSAGYFAGYEACRRGEQYRDPYRILAEKGADQ